MATATRVRGANRVAGTSVARTIYARACASNAPAWCRLPEQGAMIDRRRQVRGGIAAAHRAIPEAILYLPPESDRIQVELAHLVDPTEQLVDVVVLGV